MNQIYQMPPMLQGSAQDQVRQLRDYLARIVRQLPGAGDEGQVTMAVKQATEIASRQNKETTEAARQRARQLKDLILKTADEIYLAEDRIVTKLGQEYVAISDYGNYYETIETLVEQTAKNTVESYNYQSAIETVNGRVSDTNSRTEALENYLTEINGEIRRGIIVDPQTSEETLGIVISQELSFTGSSKDVNGQTYYYLDSGQTTGIYTSTGWQFWINGAKVGWFDSADSSLHVSQIVVEDRMKIGSDWLISTTNGWGIRYIGG